MFCHKFMMYEINYLKMADDDYDICYVPTSDVDIGDLVTLVHPGGEDIHKVIKVDYKYTPGCVIYIHKRCGLTGDEFYDCMKELLKFSDDNVREAHITADDLLVEILASFNSDYRKGLDIYKKVKTYHS